MSNPAATSAMQAAVGARPAAAVAAGALEQPSHQRQLRQLPSSAAHLRLPRRASSLRQQRLSIKAQAKVKAEPPDVPKPRDQRQGGKEWLQTILSRFGPVKAKATNTTVLDFEKPLVELDNRIREVSRRGSATVTAAGGGRRRRWPGGGPPPRDCTAKDAGARWADGCIQPCALTFCPAGAASDRGE